MFEPFALAYVDRLAGIQGDTRSKYKKEIRENMAPWFGSYSVEDGEGSIVRAMVQDWVNDLEAGRLVPLDPRDRKPRTKYPPKTVHTKHGLLSAIMQSAVDADRHCEPPTRVRRRGSPGSTEPRTKKRWSSSNGRNGPGSTDASPTTPRILARPSRRPDSGGARQPRSSPVTSVGAMAARPPKTRKSRRTVVITNKQWSGLPSASVIW